MSSPTDSSRIDREGSRSRKGNKDKAIQEGLEGKEMESQGMRKPNQEGKEKPTEKVDVERKPSDWRSLFSAHSDQSLSYFPPQQSNGRTVISPTKDVFEEGENLWQNAVVAQFIGRIPNFSLFQKLVKMLWGADGEVFIRPAGLNLFIIQLPNTATRDKVLEEGPWHIQNQPLIVRKWVPGLAELQFKMVKLPLWIHLHKVPLELFTQKGLSYIASGIGSPMYMDKITASQQRLSFAKICVEVEPARPISRSIEVVMKDGSSVSIIVEVPWYPLRCPFCAIFGHGDKTCPKKQDNVVPVQKWIPRQTKEVEVVTDENKEIDTVVENLQNVMRMVQKVQKVADEAKEPGTPLLRSDNRFVVLDDEKPIEEDIGTSMENENTAEEICTDSRKTRAAAAGVAELMQTLKPKWKGPIDKGKKQGKVGPSPLRSHSSSSSL